MRTTSQLVCFFLLFELIHLASAADKTTVFGSTEAEVSGLIGTLYDLKQTQTRKPTNVDTEGYWGVLDQFLSAGWNESVLNRYFRATRPLYATQVFIPQIKAEAAPRAFGVGDIVSASQWLVHYKGQVLAPRSGTFRFVGYCDDIMAVAVNSKLVLISGWPGMERINKVLNKTAWDSSGRKGRWAVSGSMQKGDWITLKAGEAFDLDVIVGERPGGAFCAFLFIEQEGKSYEMQDGEPILPIFQLAPTPLPTPQKWAAPTFSKTTDVWKALP